MEASRGQVLSFTLVFDEDGVPNQFVELRRSEKEIFGIGRATKSDLTFIHAGVSWHHLELKLVEEAGELALVVRDVSSNGTGLQKPGGDMQRLQTDVDTPVPDGARLVLPVVFKKKGGVQKSFTVRMSEAPIDATIKRATNDGVTSVPNADAAAGVVAARSRVPTCGTNVDVNRTQVVDLTDVAKNHSAEGVKNISQPLLQGSSQLPVARVPAPQLDRGLVSMPNIDWKPGDPLPGLPILGPVLGIPPLSSSLSRVPAAPPLGNLPDNWKPGDPLPGLPALGPVPGLLPGGVPLLSGGVGAAWMAPAPSPTSQVGPINNGSEIRSMGPTDGQTNTSVNHERSAARRRSRSRSPAAGYARKAPPPPPPPPAPAAHASLVERNGNAVMQDEADPSTKRVRRSLPLPLSRAGLPPGDWVPRRSEPAPDATPINGAQSAATLERADRHFEQPAEVRKPRKELPRPLTRAEPPRNAAPPPPPPEVQPLSNVPAVPPPGFWGHAPADGRRPLSMPPPGSGGPAQNRREMFPSSGGAPQNRRDMPSTAVGPVPTRRERKPERKEESAEEKLEKGQDLIHDGKESEDNGLFDEAYKNYKRGLKYVIDALPLLDQDDPQLESLQSMVTTYLERAARVKDMADKNTRR